jgi:acetolactate synthase-1/2/3 large subunit
MGRSRLRGGEIVCTTLQRLGVDTVFGIPGSQNLDLFDSLRQSSLRIVLATSELAATFMANGYFRASGRPAAVVTIPGPGFTYALTGLAEARHDSTALLHLIVTHQEFPDKRFQLQRIDQRAMAVPVVKRFFEIKAASDICQTLVKAQTDAVTGEPGPVVVEIDHRALTDEAEYAADCTPAADTSGVVDTQDLEEVVRLLGEHGKIAIFAGQGASSAATQVRKLAELLSSPVVTTCSGRGVLPEDHPLSFDVDFSIGHLDQVNRLFGQADLVLALGCKFSHNGTAGYRLSIPQHRLVHIDASDEVLSANYPARLAIKADVKLFLDKLWERQGHIENRSRGFEENDLRKWKASLEAARQKGVRHEPRVTGTTEGELSHFFGALRAVLPDTACVVTDTGLHQTLVRNHLRIKSRRGLITPTDYQAMGFGLPAAIGARISSPDREVVAVVGDGCFAITGLEISTAVRENLNLTVVVFNNGYLGSIRLEQLFSSGQEYAVSLTNPDFAALAKSMGAAYFRLQDDTGATLKTCLATPGVKLLEVCLEDPREISQLRSKAVLRRKLRGSVLGDIIRKLRKRSK